MAGTRGWGTDRNRTCPFCGIVAGVVPAQVVWRASETTVFLDHRPLFPGHLLVVPDRHVAALADLELAEVGPFFAVVRHMARVLPEAIDAEGTFIANNNVVSQSVPHLHVHVVPRRRGDGLRGFFWPRGRYEDEVAATAMAARITSALLAWPE